MGDPSQHAAYVDTWVDQLPGTLAPEQLISVFEQGFNALWRRAQRTLGEVTVAAIADRVLRDASQQYPVLSPLKVEADIGVQFGDLRRRIRQEDIEQLREGMRLTLTQLLTVLGNLTADILTPALQMELNGVRVVAPSANGNKPPHDALAANRKAKD